MEERWGKDAYVAGDAWWSEKGAAGQQEWKERAGQLGADWTAASRSGAAADSAAAQELARRHVDWLAGVPGTPMSTPGCDARGT